MKIAMIASEAAPFVKTGGLGDVMQALPQALAAIPGNEVCLFLPYYASVKHNPAWDMTPGLERTLQMLTSGALGQRFDDIVASLLSSRFGTPDAYMTIADFESYSQAQRRVAEVYRDQRAFTQMSLTNIAKAGVFSSDRAVREYGEKIWNL